MTLSRAVRKICRGRGAQGESPTTRCSDRTTEYVTTFNAPDTDRTQRVGREVGRNKPVSGEEETYHVLVKLIIMQI